MGNLYCTAGGNGTDLATVKISGSSSEKLRQKKQNYHKTALPKYLHSTYIFKGIGEDAPEILLMGVFFIIAKP